MVVTTANSNLSLLFVDDDEGLRSDMAEFFLRQGHRVAQCADGEQALNHFAILYEDRMPQLS